MACWAFSTFAGKDYADQRPLERYVAESKRLLSVLDTRLRDRERIMGAHYSIADIATFPWINNLINFYGARDLVGFDGYPQVARVLKVFTERPALIRGLNIPERH